jgi:ketosteroid isomerase-like protein
MNAQEVVMGYQSAMGKGDMKAARGFLADDLSFVGPFDRFSSPEPYLAALGQLAPMIERIDLKRVFHDGDEVALFYDLVTKTPAGTAPCAEWYHVKGGKITAIQVYFDGRPFAPLMGRK